MNEQMTYLNFDHLMCPYYLFSSAQRHNELGHTQCVHNDINNVYRLQTQRASFSSAFALHFYSVLGYLVVYFIYSVSKW